MVDIYNILSYFQYLSHIISHDLRFPEGILRPVLLLHADAPRQRHTSPALDDGHLVQNSAGAIDIRSMSINE